MEEQSTCPTSCVRTNGANMEKESWCLTSAMSTQCHQQPLLKQASAPWSLLCCVDACPGSASAFSGLSRKNQHASLCMKSMSEKLSYVWWWGKYDLDPCGFQVCSPESGTKALTIGCQNKAIGWTSHVLYSCTFNICFYSHLQKSKTQ